MKKKTSLSLSEGVIAKIDQLAKGEHRSRSNYLEGLILTLLDERSPTVRAARKPEAAPKTPPRRDIEEVSREIAFYEDSLIEAGTLTGSLADNPPAWVQVPPDWKFDVDFVIRVHGDSMTGVIEDGEYAAFQKSERGINGKIVAAIADGVAVVKMYNVVKGKPYLVSAATGYEPIPVNKHVKIQGIYKCRFPSPKKSNLRVRRVEPPPPPDDASHA